MILIAMAPWAPIGDAVDATSLEGSREVAFAASSNPGGGLGGARRVSNRQGREPAVKPPGGGGPGTGG